MRHRQDHVASAEDWCAQRCPALDALIRAIETMQAEIKELETRVKILELGGKK
jgi:hypothetical protein